MTVQGGASPRTLAPACCLLLCGFEKKHTLSGLLGRSRVKHGPSQPSWGLAPWEAPWGLHGNRGDTLGHRAPEDNARGRVT